MTSPCVHTCAHRIGGSNGFSNTDDDGTTPESDSFSSSNMGASHSKSFSIPGTLLYLVFPLLQGKGGMVLRRLLNHAHSLKL
mmetsp:Transcript_30482/g.65866  ORF Transcript_30482/g.65866 Transcript_30482/m.65866 type:complete len:82 (+) Transcript_30482:650-895(+)